MRRRTTSIGLVALTGLALGCKPAPTFTTQDETMLRGMFDSAVMWIQAGNYAAWAGQFAEDAVFLPPNGPMVVGRAEIQTWAERMPTVEEFSFSNVQVRGEGNFAWGTSSIVLKYEGMPADTAKQLVVYQRDAMASWMVVAVSFNSDLPRPQPAGSATPR
jgi:ketosteroid isomerase-like protein